LRPPSGEQFEIILGEQKAVVTEVGAGLRAYSVGGRDVVEGYGPDEMSAGGRGQVLIPWPNRLKNGRYEFDGRSHQLPLTEPEHGNAIHGLVRWVPWSAKEHDPHRVLVEYVLHPQPGYPFELDLRIEYALSTSGLTVTTTATNIGTAPCPYGSGSHPYLTLGTETVDELLLLVPAHTALQSNSRGIPTRTVDVAGTDLDFRTPRRIGEAKLDNGFTDLERDEDGRARVVLSTADDHDRVVVWVDESYGYLMLFTGDRPDVQRRGLAVEPMTCAPNAFRTGDVFVVLEPGATHTGKWGITPR
jgi:aldose 1-epimerase